MMSLSVWLPGPMFLPAGGGSLSGGVGLYPRVGAVQGGLYQEDPPKGNSRRYASYLNAFLCYPKLSIVCYYFLHRSCEIV